MEPTMDADAALPAVQEETPDVDTLLQHYQRQRVALQRRLARRKERYLSDAAYRDKVQQQRRASYLRCKQRRAQAAQPEPPVLTREPTVRDSSDDDDDDTQCEN